MINVFHVSFIPGMMVGIEWDYINKFVVIDLLIVRVVWDYWGYDREEIENEEP